MQKTTCVPARPAAPSNSIRRGALQPPRRNAPPRRPDPTTIPAPRPMPRNAVSFSGWAEGSTRQRPDEPRTPHAEEHRAENLEHPSQTADRSADVRGYIPRGADKAKKDSNALFG